MNRLFLLISAVIIFTIATQAQTLNTDTSHTLKSYSHYIKKRNTYNTLGWVCLGSGLTMAVTGLLLDVGGSFNHSNGKKGDGLAVAGEVVALGSIPLFIIAHHNKKLALSIKNGAVTINDRVLYKTNFTAISLAIKF